MIDNRRALRFRAIKRRSLELIEPSRPGEVQFK
jgi:hypothetical protein